MTNQSNIKRCNSQRLRNTLSQDFDSYDFITSYPPRWPLSTNTSNEKRNLNHCNSQRLRNTLSQDFNSVDFITSYPPSWLLSTNISNEKRNLDRLKTRIDCFFQEHSDLIIDIKNYFYNEIIIYILKRSFKLSFNRTDMVRTERLLDRFFIEHESNIRIIFNYFFDDIKPFLPNNSQFLFLTSELRKTNTLLNRGMCEAFIFLLKLKGAQFLTSILYPTNIIQNENETIFKQSSSSTQPTSDQMKFATILAYISMLCIIFGWNLVLIMFYFLIGLLIIAFFIYLLIKPRTI